MDSHHFKILRNTKFWRNDWKFREISQKRSVTKSIRIRKTDFYISNFQETIKCSIIFSQTTNGLDRKQWHLYLKKKIIEELKTLGETFLVIYFNRNIMHSTLW